MSALTLYLILMLDKILVISIVGVILSFVLLFVWFMLYVCNENCVKDFNKYSKTIISSFVISILFLILIPSTKQMAAIIVLPAITNSECVGKIAPKLEELSLQWIDEQIKVKGEDK